MIMCLGDLIPNQNVQTQNAAGLWVRAVHEPFRGGLFDRIRDALAVLRGADVFAVRWPQTGEWERIMARMEGRLR
jgi:hypothetical protein